MTNKRILMVILVVAVFWGSFLFSPFSAQSARATTPAVYDVFAPTATGGMYAAPSGYRLDGSSQFFGDINHPDYTWGMETYGFASTNYASYWNPWTDRATFPPNNATIIDVYAVAVCVIPGGHTATFNAIIRADGTEWKGISPAFGPTAFVHYGFHAPPVYAKELFRFNITEAYTQASGYTVLGAVNWTPMLLKSLNSGASGGWLPPTSRAFCIQMWMGGNAYWTGYEQIDYLGIEYRWRANDTSTPPTTSPDDSGSPVPHLVFPSWGSGGWFIKILTVSMGVVGLIGMIAYPAAAIKTHKKGGNIETSIVNFLILEFLFIGMLYAALVIA